MIGLVLVTHGRLAEEFISAMQHVVGPQEQIKAVCIGPDDDMEVRRSEILNKVSEVDKGSGAIVLTDMFGGTPSNLAISIMDKAKVEASDDYWGEYNDDDFRYARIGIKGCYGEDIMLQSYIKLFPAQFTPTISEMTRGELYGDGDETDLVKLEGKLDVEKVNKALFLATNYKKADQQEGELDVYEPEEGDIDEAGEIFKINFSSSQESTNIVQSKVKIDGDFSARAVHIQSTVDLTNNQMANFYNLRLGNTAVSGGKFYLRINGDYVKAPEDAGENGIEIEVKETNEGNN